MSIEVAMWKIGDKPERVEFSPIDSEKRLEDLLAQDISMVHHNLFLIGRQVPTAYGKFVDLLALDGNANLVVIELKRDRTPRDVVAQTLDYGSWVRDLEDDEIAAIFDEFRSKYFPGERMVSLDEAFCANFGAKQMPDTLNESHELIVVAGQLDDSTERIINYLAEEYGVSINAVFFRFFRDGANEYLSRAWLTDPEEVELKKESGREKLPWNGEYYVSFGGKEDRVWEEARKYGFISAGDGAWYTNTLKVLTKGARIWVNKSGGVGYVGVGRVVEEVVPIDEFMVEDDAGKRVPISSMTGLKASTLRTKLEDAENAEHFVRVEWIATVPESEAVREKGFFGNQNTAAKPRDRKWQHTVDRLSKRFSVELAD